MCMLEEIQACTSIMIIIYLYTAQIRQFDTMIFPEAKDKYNIFKRTFNKILWRTGSDHPTFSVPPPDEMRCICLDFHLEPVKGKLLTGQFEEGFDISEAVEHFIGLYQCCYCQYYACTELYVYEWKIMTIKNVSCNYLIIKNIIDYVVMCISCSAHEGMASGHY